MVSCEERNPTRLCPFSVIVQHPNGDGDKGDPRWISRWTTNWRANSHEPSLRWTVMTSSSWAPVGHFCSVLSHCLIFLFSLFWPIRQIDRPQWKFCLQSVDVLEEIFITFQSEYFVCCADIELHYECSTSIRTSACERFCTGTIILAVTGQNCPLTASR